LKSIFSINAERVDFKAPGSVIFKSVFGFFGAIDNNFNTQLVVPLVGSASLKHGPEQKVIVGSLAVPSIG